MFPGAKVAQSKLSSAMMHSTNLPNPSFIQQTLTKSSLHDSY
jgi:hypothetical protein